MNAKTPVTVLTGFVGAGKTSLILSLLSQLPDGHRIAILKNEFGSVEVDAALVKQQEQRDTAHLQIREMQNGCLCCTLVGQLEPALAELLAMTPERIVIETSGSAFPASLAWELKRMEEAGMPIYLDAMLCVVDCINFTGYEDTSHTARLQAQYTDMLLLNKWEHVTEDQLDRVLDRLFDVLDPDIPRVKCQPGGHIHPNVVFGLHVGQSAALSGPLSTAEHSEYDVIEVHAHNASPIDLPQLERFLQSASSDFYRIKGFVPLSTNETAIVNWAFGRHRLTTVLRQEPLSLMLVGRSLISGSEISSQVVRWLCEGLGVDSSAIRIQQHSHDHCDCKS